MKNMDKNSKKKEIRKEILKHRRSLTEEEIRSGSSHAIAEKTLSMEVYQKAEAVYLYIDCKGEASVREIYEAALWDDKRIAAPRVHGEDMTLYYIHSMEEDLEPGYFAIPEPKTFRKLRTKRRFFWCLAWDLILSAIVWVTEKAFMTVT